MFKFMLAALSGFAALLMLAAAPAQAQTSCKNLGINFSCNGGGGGKLNLSCAAGQSDAQCCNRFRTSVRRLCGGGLSSYRCGCNKFCNAAGQCWDGTGATTSTSPNDQGQIRPGIPGAVQRPCARVAFNYVCTTGRKGSAGGVCPRGQGTKACCKARLSLACGGEGLVNFARSTCRCVGPGIFRRRR